jgi:hypothetical protein
VLNCCYRDGWAKIESFFTFQNSFRRKHFKIEASTPWRFVWAYESHFATLAVYSIEIFEVEQACLHWSSNKIGGKTIEIGVA